MSSFAENRFRDMQLRLHRQYGYGLRNLAVRMNGLRGQAPSADYDPSSTEYTGPSIVVNEFEIEPFYWKSFPLGVVGGL